VNVVKGLKQRGSRRWCSSSEAKTVEARKIDNARPCSEGRQQLDFEELQIQGVKTEVRLESAQQFSGRIASPNIQVVLKLRQ
jgi:hypothetical protein